MDDDKLLQTKEGDEAVLCDPPVGDLRPSDRRVHHGWSWQRSNYQSATHLGVEQGTISMWTALQSIDDRLEHLQEILWEQSPTYEGETGHADCTSQGDELTDDRREFQIIDFSDVLRFVDCLIEASPQIWDRCSKGKSQCDQGHPGTIFLSISFEKIISNK